MTFNFTDMFNSLHPLNNLSVGVRDILQAFTQFLPRVLEQSLISGTNPELNGGGMVYFNHVSFSAALLENYPPPLLAASYRCGAIHDYVWRREGPPTSCGGRV